MSPTASPDPKSAPGPWQVEFDAYARAAGGAILFGVPLLFTMEMWWIGAVQPAAHLLAFVVVAFAANVLLARMSGYRPDHGSLRTDVESAIGALALGAVISAVMLLALGRITGASSLAGIIGMVAVQMIPLSIGASVANVVFSAGRADSDDGEGEQDDGSEQQPTEAEQAKLRRSALLNDIGATIAGAIFIGFSIAPTDEIPMLATGLGKLNVVAVFVITLISGYVIVFASGFDPEHRNGDGSGGAFQHPLTETVLATVISLVVAAGLLIGFGQISAGVPFHTALMYTLVLGVPASIGGAAGRVVI